MGGGNAQKSKTKRERAMKMKKKSGASTKYDRTEIAKREAYMCMICRQTFASTASESTLKEHVASKHSGKKTTRPFAECFPGYGETDSSAAGASAMAVPMASAATAAGSGSVKKKKKKKGRRK